ncbi:MAG: glycosyltransferase [Armatimonadetes bacterium]|nr:glycosyltransferase [Armatimonadota bacterium]
MLLWLLLACVLGAAVLLHKLGWRPVRRVQPLPLDGRSPGIGLDCHVLKACGCEARLPCRDLFLPLPYYFGPGLESIHLFVERIPWWAIALDRNRTWVLWNHEIPTGYQNLGRASVILCKTRVGVETARAAIRQRGLSARAIFVGFTSFAVADVRLPQPAADREPAAVLHLGGQSEHKQTSSVLRAWLAHPEFPMLEATCFGKGWRALDSGLRARAERAPNIRLHTRALERVELERMLCHTPIHLCPSAAEGFGHSLNESRFHGALIVTTAGEPMSGYGNLLVPCRAEGVWNRVEPEDIATCVQAALELSPEERGRAGRQNQRRLLQDHGRFFESFSARIHAIRQGRAPRVTLLMGRLPPRTGGEEYNAQILEELLERGCVVDYVHVSAWRTLSLVGLIPGWPGALLSCPLLAAVLGGRGGLFLCDEHFLAPLFLTNWLRAGPVAAVVHHMEGYSSRGAPGWRQSLQRAWRRLLLGRAARMVAVSQHTRTELLSLGLDPRRIVVVPPGFEPGSLPARPAPLEAKTLRCLCVGACIPRKGLRFLLEAMLRLGSSVRLTVAGDTGDRHYRLVLKPLAEKLGERVSFEGRVSPSRLESLYASNDVFVMPSLEEGFGIALAEAMHRGLPVVASRIGAFQELVEDGVQGMLVPPGDAGALAQALHTLAGDPALLRRMGEQGPRRARGFNWGRTRREFLEALEPWLVPGTLARDRE